MKYLQNKTSNTLVVGYLEIAKGKYGDISDNEAESAEVMYAIRSKWASLHDTPPADIVFDEPEMVFEKPSIMGMDEFPKEEEKEEEVKPVAEKAAKVEVEPVVEKAAEVVKEKSTRAKSPKTAE